MNKTLLEQNATKSKRAITSFSNRNNAYHEEIKIRTKLLKKKLAHRKAQKKYRKYHAEEIKVYNRKYYLAHRQLKRICEHIAKIEINPNYDSVRLICTKCGCLLGKSGF